jgi:hypothetical protein
LDFLASGPYMVNCGWRRWGASTCCQSTKINYWETKWGQMFHDPDVEKPWTKVGKFFRQRWRMDKVLMDHIIELCRSVNLWDITHPHLMRVPLESLRHRNWYFTTFIHYLYCIVSSTLSYICKHYWKVSLMSFGTKQICRLWMWLETVSFQNVQTCM